MPRTFCSRNMALIVSGITPCVLCGEKLGDEPISATSGCAFPPGTKLYPYCDAPFHIRCLDHWDHREAFSRGYFEIRREDFQAMRTLLHDHPLWVLGCGPAPADQLPYYARVYFRDWPQCLNCDFRDWDQFLKEPFSDEITGGVLDIAEEVVSWLRIEVPNLEALATLRTETIKAEQAGAQNP